MMSEPAVSETRDQCVGPLVSGVVTPVVEGDDSYIAMIWSLLCMADSRNELGDLVTPPSDLQVDFQTRRWMDNKALSPKYIEDECLSTLSALCDALQKSSFYGSCSIGDGGSRVSPVSGLVFNAAGLLGCACVG